MEEPQAEMLIGGSLARDRSFDPTWWEENRAGISQEQKSAEITAKHASRQKDSGSRKQGPRLPRKELERGRPLQQHHHRNLEAGLRLNRVMHQDPAASPGRHKSRRSPRSSRRAGPPCKKLSPDAPDGIRTLHTRDPITYDTPLLAEHFKVSPEAIRRILKSKWRPSDEEEDDRRRRWEKRGQRIWDRMSSMGLRSLRRISKGAQAAEGLSRGEALESILSG